ncbi:MAG: hypothetical protein M3Q73_02160 [bacterium]|nr:hypothetical protein [bacterium]
MYPPLFYIALFIHVISFIIGFGAVIVIDTFGSLWLIKRVKLATVNTVANVTEKLIWLGWSGLVLSGSVLLYHKGFIDNLTWIKLFFVLMLGLNGLFLHSIKKSMERLGTPEELPKIIMFRTALASAISQLGWWGAISIGFYHRHISSFVSWPENPWIIIAGVFTLIAAAAIIGETLLRNKAQSIGIDQLTENI